MKDVKPRKGDEHTIQSNKMLFICLISCFRQKHMQVRFLFGLLAKNITFAAKIRV